MPLSGPINHAHPAASDFFQNLIVAQVPICVGSVNFTQQVIERFLGLRAIAVGVNTRREKTVQTKTATNSRCRSTLWADARFILEGEGNRSVGRTHARRKGKDSRSCCKPLQSKIKSLSNIFLFIRPGVNCLRKTAKKHAVWFEYSYPKIPEVKFLRNFRNLTTDDTARLCRNQRDALAKNLRKLQRVWSIACDLAREGEKLRFSPPAISRHLALDRKSVV